MKAVVFSMIVVFSGMFMFGCSQESRKEAIDRTSNAMNVLNGGDKSAEQEHETPLVVKEQQKKEIIRQNTKWTPENQKLYPIEYCQAQLKELDDNAKKLDVVSHTIATQLNRVTRTMDENAQQTAALTKFLADAKSKYQAAEAAGKWPMELNGFMLSREKVQEKVIEADRKLTQLKEQVSGMNNTITTLKKKQAEITEKQKLNTALKEKVQLTINDLRTKQVVEGDKGITDTLNAINDSINALSVDPGDPDLSSLVIPSDDANREDLFNEIMKK